MDDIKDYAAHLRKIQHDNQEPRFAKARQEDLSYVLKECESAARDGKSHCVCTIGGAEPQDVYCHHLCAMLRERQLAAGPLDDADSSDANVVVPNYFRIMVMWN